jgi:hypothetical protein
MGIPGNAPQAMEALVGATTAFWRQSTNCPSVFAWSSGGAWSSAYRKATGGPRALAHSTWTCKPHSRHGCLAVVFVPELRVVVHGRFRYSAQRPDLAVTFHMSRTRLFCSRQQRQEFGLLSSSNTGFSNNAHRPFQTVGEHPLGSGDQHIAMAGMYVVSLVSGQLLPRASQHVNG